MQQKRSLRIDVFDNFRKAMLNYFSHYSKPDEEKKKKSTTSHRIAIELARQFPSRCNIDIDYMNSDIIIRDGDDILLILLWSHDYLTEKDKDKARSLHIDKSPLLTLAFSLLEEKSYILIYRFEKEYLEYPHIDKSDFSEKILKRSEDRDRKEKDQLMLGLKGKAQRKPRKTREKEKNESSTLSQPR